MKTLIFTLLTLLALSFWHFSSDSVDRFDLERQIDRQQLREAKKSKKTVRQEDFFFYDGSTPAPRIKKIIQPKQTQKVKAKKTKVRKVATAKPKKARQPERRKEIETDPYQNLDIALTQDWSDEDFDPYWEEEMFEDWDYDFEFYNIN